MINTWLMLVKQCHVYHPPGKSPFLWRWDQVTNPKSVVYDIVLTTKNLWWVWCLGIVIFLIVTMILYRLLYVFFHCYYCYYDFLIVTMTLLLCYIQKSHEARLPASSHLATSPQPATSAMVFCDMRHLTKFKDQYLINIQKTINIEKTMERSTIL